MSSSQPEFDAQFEADLERLRDRLRAGASETTSETGETDATLLDALAEQHEIDQSVRRQFEAATGPTDAQLAELTARFAARSDHKSSGHVGPASGGFTNQPRKISLLLAVAAAVAVAATAALWRGQGLGGRNEPYFAPTPLTDLYKQVAAAGFEPYYQCEDPQRFAEVFRIRQGVPLQLAAMPEGTRMLGLSYPGGLSRDTTAMLCMVDGQQVMAVVDRADRDDATLAKSTDALHVFRDQRDGLVFYEISPHEQPRVLEYLQPLD